MPFWGCDDVASGDDVAGARFRVPYISVGPLWDRVDNMMTWHVKKSGPAEGVGVRGRSPWVNNHFFTSAFWHLVEDNAGVQHLVEDIRRGLRV